MPTYSGTAIPNLPRDGMETLIRQLRQLTYAGTADATIAGVSYWSDYQLQEALDRNAIKLNAVTLQANPRQIASGYTEWHEYTCKYGNFEQPGAGGSAIFMLQNSTGVVQAGALYTADYQNGVFTFAADQGGTVYMLTGYSFDLNGAAAEVWGQKAAQYGMAFDFSTDNHSIRRGSVVKQALEMAKFYAGQARLTSVNIGRSDDMADEHHFHKHPREYE